MHTVQKMRPVATDRVAWSVCLSVHVKLVSGHVRELCRTDELIEMPIGALTRVDPRNHVLYGSRDPGKGQFWGCPALLNTLAISAAPLYAAKNQ